MWCCIDRKNNKQTLINTDSYNRNLDMKHHHAIEINKFYCQQTAQQV
jgi:hypothetical protein